MLKRFIIINLLLSISLFAGVINLAVAANVSYAMGALKKEFHKLYPDTKVQVTLGGSGRLTAQIKNGAPFDLFMSANMKYPQTLYKSKYAITKPTIYAKGLLSYLSVKKQDFSKGIELVKQKSISKIAIANPKIAPYGMATLQALKRGGVYDDVERKLVYAESISQTVSYVISAADIGFVAKSSLYSAGMKKYRHGVNWSDVNPKLYNPINQGVVILKNGEKNPEVLAFYNFLLSKKAKKIFNDFGYIAK